MNDIEILGMAKITIKHYLNTRLKPLIVDGVLKYTVYVRVTYDRKNNRFTSQWINYPISENELEISEIIGNLVKYETRIINEILTNAKYPESINLISRLRYSTVQISECFLNYTLDPKKVKQQIRSFIIQKTELKENIINPYVNVDHIDSLGWLELSERGVFDNETKLKTIFLAMLLDFQEKNYPDLMEYEAGRILNFYEWGQNNGKNMFVEYSKMRNLLTENNVLGIIQEFDIQIDEWRSFDMLG